MISVARGLHSVHCFDLCMSMDAKLGSRAKNEVSLEIYANS